MRFAVHRPGNPVASPRSHGVPRRDVPGRVHVSVAGVSAGGASEDGLALTRLPIHMPARRAPLARERGFDLLHPAGRFVLQAADQQAPPGPHDAPGSARPSARTFRPGFSRVPLADRVMFLICRSSTLITSNRRAMSVDGLLCPVLTPVRLAGAQPRDSELDPCAAVRAAPGAGELALQPPQRSALPRGQAGRVQQLPGRQGRADRHPAVDADDLPVTWRADRLRDRGEGDMPAPGAVHASPGRTSPLAVRRGTSGTAPIRPSAPRPRRRRRDRRRTSHAARRPTIRNPSSRPALRHDGRPAGLSGSKNAAIAWAKSRSACCCTIWEPAASHGCSARAAVSCRHCSR